MDNVLLLLSSCGLVFVFADRLSGEMLFMMFVDNLLLLNLGFDEFVYLYRSSGQMLFYDDYGQFIITIVCWCDGFSFVNVRFNCAWKKDFYIISISQFLDFERE